MAVISLIISCIDWMVLVGGLPVKSLPRGKFFMSKRFFLACTHITGAHCPRLPKHLRHETWEVKKSCNQLHFLPHFIPKLHPFHLLPWQFWECQGNKESLENALTFSDFPHRQGGIHKSRITHQSKKAKSSIRPWQEPNQTDYWLVLGAQPTKTILNPSILSLPSPTTSRCPWILDFCPQEAEICPLPYCAICTHFPTHHHVAI